MAPMTSSSTKYAMQISHKDSRFSSMKLQSPYGNTLIPKKVQKHVVLHKYFPPKCSYYLYNLKKVYKKDLDERYDRNKHKFHYITASSRWISSK